MGAGFVIQGDAAMRSFKTSTKMLALTASLLAVPFAGASAAGFGGHDGALPMPAPTAFQGPRIDSVVGQLQGLDQGITDAAQARTITPAEAHGLEMRDARIIRTAERVAARNHDRLPSGDYHRIMRRVDGLDQQLLLDTGSANLVGDGADGGHYPNG